ncbi:acyltransferase family protein [Vibrio cortegadensis]|uniref:Acyltransferase family protein n=1 Tax=Vibrio cortegadensis TaxID=1328770 RepID=A0ABV4M6G4_9VIBR
MHINSFTQFRAIAILFIISGHSFSVVGMSFDSLFDKAVMNFISGGTSLFVFISGFLFHHVFYSKFNHKKFIIKKCQNVLCPYLIIGLAPITLYVVTQSSAFDGYFLPNGEGILSEYIVPIIKYYISGRFITAYWYIPFIMITFFLSPIHVMFIRLNLKFQMMIIILLSLVAVFIHRPIDNINVIQSFVYFTPVYLIGMVASIHKNHIYKYLGSKEIYIFVFIFLVLLLQIYWGCEGSSHKQPFEFVGLDLMFIQKIALCFFFMVLLHRFEDVDNKYINVIASTSFAAFFIHPFVISIISRLNLHYIQLDSWLFFVFFVGLLLSACIIASLSVKKLIPNHSRYILGY